MLERYKQTNPECPLGRVRRQDCVRHHGALQFHTRAVAGVALGVLLTTGVLSAQGSATVTINPNQAIGPNPGTWTFDMDIAGIPSFAPITAVGVELTMDHTWSSDLEMSMTDPLANTRITLHLTWVVLAIGSRVRLLLL